MKQELIVVVQDLLHQEDYPGDEVIIETILKECPDWTRDEAVDFMEDITKISSW